MRKISLVSVATLTIVMTGVGGWVVSTAPARVEAAASVQSIYPLRMNVPHDLPTQDLTDYTFVFN